ncbi:flippase [Limosilactobacillus vaginalis]|uniref:flippase n=1 Tax=Limosilactobacillus vaginalis TaxID=1633 RepID=UPI0025A49EE0|nr:flippase [Limosilactobacillus vaginalis]MDM8261387.1 flippase [Limosilactobacillus vaginalis]
MKRKTNIKIHSIKYNLFMNVILKASAFIFPLITFPYVSRILGAGANGKISFASSVISYFSLCASLGIPSYGIRKCAEVRDDRELLSKTVQELLMINIVCTVISYTILVMLIFIIPKFYNQRILFWVTSLSIIFNTLGVDWFYQSIEQYDYITIRNILFKLIAVVLMFTFIREEKDYIFYAGITVIGSVGSNILNMLKLNHYVTFKKYHNYNFIQHLQPIFVLFLYNATTTIFTNLDQVMLGFMSNSKEVGYYAATVKIKNILISVITALGSVMLPRVAYYLKKNEKGKFIFLIRESFDFIFVSAVPIAIFFIVESRYIILFLAGDGYEKSITILQLIAPSVIFIGLSSVTAWQLLIPLKMEKYTVIGAVIGSIINLTVNFALIPNFGGAGAAIATTVAELAVLLTHFFFLRGKMKSMLDIKELVITTLSGVIALIGLLLLNSLIKLNNSFLQCIVASIVFFGIYFLALLLLRESIITDYVKNLVSKVR